jgi:hypothetical protein
VIALGRRSVKLAPCSFSRRGLLRFSLAALGARVHSLVRAPGLGVWAILSLSFALPNYTCVSALAAYP